MRSDDNFIAGERRSLADFHLAPICFYVALTPDAGEVFGVKGFAPWWERMQALPSSSRPRRNWASGGKAATPDQDPATGALAVASVRPIAFVRCGSLGVTDRLSRI